MSVARDAPAGSVPQRGLTVKVPSKTMCRRILEAAKVTTASMAHAEMVEEVASAIAEEVHKRFPGKVDLRLVSAGAMLHEMGTSRERGLRYIMAGVGMAHQLGLDPRLIEVIRRHKGAGMGYMEAARIGLPLHDLVPRTLEELIVSHADLLVEGDRRLKAAQVADRFWRAGLPDCAARIVDIHRRLSLAADEDVDRLGPQGGWDMYDRNRVDTSTEVDPGRLLVVEDDPSIDKKKEYMRGWGTRLFAILGITMLVALLFMFLGASNDDKPGIFTFGALMLMIPISFMGIAVKEMGAQDHQRNPLKVYTKGIAYREMSTAQYVFVPWSDLEVYQFRIIRDIGYVLDVGDLTVRIRFLPSMKEYDVVEALVRRYLVEVTKWQESRVRW